jgi:hypothetical protein
MTAPRSIQPSQPQKLPTWAIVLIVIVVAAVLISPKGRAVLMEALGEQVSDPQSPPAKPRPSESREVAVQDDDQAPPSSSKAPSEDNGLPAGSKEPRSAGPLSKYQKGERGSDKEPPAKAAVPTISQGPKPSGPQPDPKSDPAADDAGPKLGVLREVRKDVLVSTAGLVYRRGSVDGHRLDHVMEHSKDRTDKPVHGVFVGTQDEILAVIDEGYLLAKKRGPPQVKKEIEGDRTSYLINMNRKIGYLGGQVGQRKNHPPCRLLQLVLEEDEVITAFPTDR